MVGPVGDTDRMGRTVRGGGTEELAARVQGVLGIPFHQFLGVALADPENPATGITVPVGPRALNNVGVLHGGIVTALLDVACYLALLPGLAGDEAAVTHDIAPPFYGPSTKDRNYG